MILQSSRYSPNTPDLGPDIFAICTLPAAYLLGYAFQLVIRQTYESYVCHTGISQMHAIIMHNTSFQAQHMGSLLSPLETPACKIQTADWTPNSTSC